MFTKRTRLSRILSAPVLQQLSKIGLFSTVFAIVKSNGFTAALFLSFFAVDIAAYGLFEYALSLGLMLCIPLNSGLQAAYPYFYIRQGKVNFRPVFHLHASMIGSLVLLFLILQNLWLAIDIKYTLALLFAACLSLQMMLSVMMKSGEKIFGAVILESGLFIVLNAYNAWIYWQEGALVLPLLINIYSVYLLALTAFHSYSFFRQWEIFRWSNYRESLRFGRQVTVAAFLIIFLSSSARIFIEYFLGMESVGLYAFYFRLAAVLILIHQIVNIFFFKKMYQASYALLDKGFAGFLLLMGITGLSTAYCVPLIAKTWPDIAGMHQSEYTILFYLLIFQMIFWSAMALYENIVYRERLSTQMNRGFVFLVVSMIIIYFGMHWMSLIDLKGIIIVNVVLLFLACEIQNKLLKKQSILFRRTSSVNRIIFLFFLLLAVFN